MIVVEHVECRSTVYSCSAAVSISAFPGQRRRKCIPIIPQANPIAPVDIISIATKNTLCLYALLVYFVGILCLLLFLDRGGVSHPPEKLRVESTAVVIIYIIV